MRREDRAPSVEAADGVLDVDVVDAVGELQSEGGRVEELVREMGRIEIDPERGTAVDRLERLAGRDEVVSDLGRVHLEPEPHPLLLEDVEDRPPALREVLIPTLNHGEVVRRKE